MQTMLDRFAEHATARPGKPFVLAWEDGRYRVLTYGDLLQEARHMAAHLGAHPSGGVVFIVLKPSVDLYPAYLGCMLAGLIPSFLPFPTPKQDPSLYFSSHKELFARTPPACVVTYPTLLPALRDALPSGTPILDIGDLHGAADSAAPPRTFGATALLQFSSGTTGLKKGVALTFQQIGEQVAAYAPAADLSQDSVVVSWLPLYHDMGLFTGFLIPLSLGASVVSIDPFEWVRRPALLLELVEAFRGTHVWLPNFAFQHILATTDASAKFDLSSLKQVISCSETVKPSVLRRFTDRFAAAGLDAFKIKACYAMAEACFAVTQSYGQAVSSPRFESESVSLGREPRLAETGSTTESRELAGNGRAIAGLDIGIFVDGEIQTVATTSVGEIVLRGAFIFGRYHRAPEDTAPAIRNGWYHTGDIGFLRRGELFVCGRLKELIIVHGRNYYCHDIEAIASEVSGIARGRVIAVGEATDESTDEELLLIAELDGLGLSSHEAVRRDLKKAIFTHLGLTPRRIEFVSRGWLVKTTSGKLSRAENLGRLQREQAEQYSWPTKQAS